MNAREMFRQTTNKRPNTSSATEQTDSRRCRLTLAAQVAKSGLSSNGNNVLIGTLSTEDGECHGRSPEVTFHLSSPVAMDTPSVSDERSRRQRRIA